MNNEKCSYLQNLMFYEEDEVERDRNARNGEGQLHSNRMSVNRKREKEETRDVEIDCALS